jgi:hypothetical protein
MRWAESFVQVLPSSPRLSKGEQSHALVFSERIDAHWVGQTQQSTDPGGGAAQSI